MNDFKSRDDCGTACGGLRIRVAAEVGDVVHAGGDAGDAFVVERAPLPAVGNGVSKRANFVRTQAGEMLALAEEDSHVRAKEFVGGADEKIAVEVDGVDVGERSIRVRQTNDFFYRIDGADRVGGIADGDEPGF